MKTRADPKLFSVKKNSFIEKKEMEEYIREKRAFYLMTEPKYALNKDQMFSVERLY